MAQPRDGSNDCGHPPVYHPTRRLGWREPEVRAVIRRALPALGQAALLALQDVAVLAAANRLPGRVIAFQISLNFYFLASAIG